MSVALLVCLLGLSVCLVFDLSVSGVCLSFCLVSSLTVLCDVAVLVREKRETEAQREEREEREEGEEVKVMDDERFVM